MYGMSFRADDDYKDGIAVTEMDPGYIPAGGFVGCHCMYVEDEDASGYKRPYGRG